MKTHNMHFKSPTRSQAACGLNASYVDCSLSNKWRIHDKKEFNVNNLRDQSQAAYCQAP